MSDANPILIAGGYQFESVKRLTVQWGAKQAVRAFGLTVTDSADPIQEQWNFMPGTDVTIMESGETMLTGYVHRMSPSYDGKDHKVEISGSSKSTDIVHSTAEPATGEYRNKSVLDIAKDLDKQGVGFHSTEQLEKHDYFRVNPYETIFQTIERLSRKEMLLLIGRADGGVDIAKGGMMQVNAPLVEGQNILAGSAVFDDGDKSSEYKVKGQRALGVNRKAIQISATSKDSSVKRHRPKHLHHEGDADQKHAQTRADHHRDRQLGESVSASARVQGWRDENGLLYKENSLIYVYSPMFKLSMQMLIESIECTIEESGSFTQLSLVHPKALGSMAASGSNTDNVWMPGF